MKAKPFNVTQKQVLNAYKRVRSNGGGSGCDKQTLSEFAKDWKNNLYIIWNRMASGSYMPSAVRCVEIPKLDGGKRVLGIPNVGDRIAQTVVKQVLEPIVEVIFHRDSYGYRPGKSAHQAVEQARKLCWKYAWVVDVDIKGFFDNIDQALLLKAVKLHTKERWIIMYIERWLKAPMQMPDGTLQSRTRGIPQGGSISPLLANLFLHYVFDRWMTHQHAAVPFERFADDVICHCHSQMQANQLLEALRERFSKYGLELHPLKTRVVYCKSGKRRGTFLEKSFDFLGFSFRPRQAKSKEGQSFLGFNPAISPKSAKTIRQKVRRWRPQRFCSKTLAELAKALNPMIRGWINYFGAFYKSALNFTLRQIDRALVMWVRKKYKRFRSKQRRATQWLKRIAIEKTGLFAHWVLLLPKGSMRRAV